MRAVQVVALVVLVGAVTVGCYFWLLGWHRRTTGGVNAYLSQPTHGWQLALFVVLLGAVSLGAGWVRRPIVGSLTIAVALTTCWTLDATLNVRGDRNWPIGMTLVAWASLGGSLVLAGTVTELRLIMESRAEAAQQAALAAEAARLRAEARAAELIRMEAERAAAANLAAAEARRLEREAAAQDVAEQARLAQEANGNRRVKVAKVFSSSAAKVRARSRAR
jgi:hypothetical protein